MVSIQFSAAANLCSLRTVNAVIHLPKLPSLSNGSKDQLERNNMQSWKLFLTELKCITTLFVNNVTIGTLFS